MANTLNHANSSEDYIQHFTCSSFNHSLVVHAANDEQFLLASYDESPKNSARQSRQKWNARQALAARGIAYEPAPAYEEASLIKPLYAQNTYSLKLTNS